MNVKHKIEKLKKELNQHNINYYVNDNPTISDSEYDSFLLQLEELDKENPSLISPDIVWLCKYDNEINNIIDICSFIIKKAFNYFN